MRFIPGFDDEILEALDSKNPEIRYEAVVAAGNWELAAAWPHVASLINSRETDKPLLLAAIEAVATIRPREAAQVLADLADSYDEDIVDTVEEAIAMADGLSAADEDEEDDEFDDDEEDDDDDDKLHH